MQILSTFGAPPVKTVEIVVFFACFEFFVFQAIIPHISPSDDCDF